MSYPRIRPMLSTFQRPLVLLVLVLTVALLAAACGSDSEPEPSTPASTTVPGGSGAPAGTIPSDSLTNPLGLRVTSPDSSVTVDVPWTGVFGIASNDAVVTVNGTTVDVDALGAFEAIVSLVEGPNLVEVVSSDLSGATETASLVVFHSAPTSSTPLSVFYPTDALITSSSTVRVVGGTSLAAVVSINGVAADVDVRGIFDVAVPLQDGANLIEVVVSGGLGASTSSSTLTVFLQR